MNLYVILRVLYDEYWQRESFGEAVCASFDEEQAREIVRARNLAGWRESPARFAAAFQWQLEDWGFQGLGPGDIDDETLLVLIDDDRRLFEVVAVDLAPITRAMTRAGQRRALRELSPLLRPWNDDAADALASLKENR